MGVFLSDEEHFGHEIGGDNAAVGADGFSESEGRFTGATGQIENMEARRELGAVENEAGGGARLERKLVEPLLPEGSGFEPFPTNDFFGIGRGCGVGAQMLPPGRRCDGGPRNWDRGVNRCEV